jgi:hypothetical protein
MFIVKITADEPISLDVSRAAHDHRQAATRRSLRGPSRSGRCDLCERAGHHRRVAASTRCSARPQSMCWRAVSVAHRRLPYFR